MQPGDEARRRIDDGREEPPFQQTLLDQGAYHHLRLPQPDSQGTVQGINFGEIDVETLPEYVHEAMLHQVGQREEEHARHNRCKASRSSTRKYGF